MKEECFRCISSPRTSRHLVRKAIEELREHLWDDALLYELELVLMEACSNVVLHAYPEGKGLFEVKVRVHPCRFIEFEIVNWGREFTGPCAPVTQVDPEAVSGRGLYIIFQIMDDCRFEREGDKNIIVLHKDIEEQLWKNCT